MSTVQAKCQKCHATGHWTYECKNPRVHLKRPTQVQMLTNPDLKPKLLADDEEIPEVPMITDYDYYRDPRLAKQRQEWQELRKFEKEREIRRAERKAKKEERKAEKEERRAKKEERKAKKKERKEEKAAKRKESDEERHRRKRRRSETSETESERLGDRSKKRRYVSSSEEQGVVSEAELRLRDAPAAGLRGRGISSRRLPDDPPVETRALRQRNEARPAKSRSPSSDISPARSLIRTRLDPRHRYPQMSEVKYRRSKLPRGGDSSPDSRTQCPHPRIRRSPPSGRSSVSNGRGGHRRISKHPRDSSESCGRRGRSSSISGDRPNRNFRRGSDFGPAVPENDRRRGTAAVRGSVPRGGRPQSPSNETGRRSGRSRSRDGPREDKSPPRSQIGRHFSPSPRRLREPNSPPPRGPGPHGSLDEAPMRRRYSPSPPARREGHSPDSSRDRGRRPSPIRRRWNPPHLSRSPRNVAGGGRRRSSSSSVEEIRKPNFDNLPRRKYGSRGQANSSAEE